MSTLHALPAPTPLQGEPPPELEPESFAERLYLALAPLAWADEDNAWALLIYCNAIGTMFQRAESIIRDSPEGPGYSILMDLDRCPPEALPWLAQFVGVRIPSWLAETESRAYIAAHRGFDRGTPEAIRQAAQTTLTGDKTVLLRERDGDPYYLTVITFTDETPDAAATLAALLEAKPAGLVLTHAVSDGQDWLALRGTHATWTAVMADYADWTAVVADET